MTKKLLVVSLVLVGLIVGTGMAYAEETTAVAPTDASTVPDVNLQAGVKNPNVKKLQELLKSLGYLPADLAPTEYLGPKTKEAIINFQKSQGLPAAGYFGPATRAALKEMLKKDGKAVGKIDTEVDVACMKTAVETRETALLTAWDAYSGKIKTAREMRKTDLSTAWSIQDAKERRAAIDAAWKKYRESVKIATVEWNQGRKTAWTQFVKDAKNCRASVVETSDAEKPEVVAE